MGGVVEWRKRKEIALLELRKAGNGALMQIATCGGGGGGGI